VPAPTHPSPVRPALPALLALAFLAACGGSPAQAPRTTGTGQVEAAGPTHGTGVPFSLHGIWNAGVGRAPIDPRSRALIAGLAAEAALEHSQHEIPTLTTSTYGVAVAEVPAGAPTVRVTLVDHAPDDALERAWARVPLPSGARPASGSDGQLVVWQPATDRLWEFWRLRRDAAVGWVASWGGAMRHVSQNPGYYTDAAWPGAKTWWGGSATSLALLGGTVRAAELRDGAIDHAVAIGIPDPRAGAWATPAQRGDGTNSAADALPEGAHLRLDPHFDLRTADLPPLTRLIAQAAQRYGLVVRDRAGALTFYGDTQIPAQPVEDFPWGHLQVLRLKLRTRADLLGGGR